MAIHSKLKLSEKSKRPGNVSTIVITHYVFVFGGISDRKQRQELLLRHPPGTDMSTEQIMQVSDFVLSVKQLNDPGRVVAVQSAKPPFKKVSNPCDFCVKIIRKM